MGPSARSKSAANKSLSVQKMAIPVGVHWHDAEFAHPCIRYGFSQKNTSKIVYFQGNLLNLLFGYFKN